MAKRILWVHSSSLETESYRDALADRGYSVDNAGNVADALFMIDGRRYEALCLSPFYLNFGLIDETKYPVVKTLDLRDPLSAGVFLYKRIKERQSDVPIFFVTINLRGSSREKLDREITKDEVRRIINLLDVGPKELSEIVARELR